jgi:chromosome segregation ATPase
MDRNQLLELKDRLAMLPGLQDKLDKLRRRIHEAEDEMKELLKSFEAETRDVEQLKKESFSSTLLKLVGKYEGKLDRETEEALAAKREYDKSTERVRDLNREYNELGSRVMELKNDKERVDAELQAREDEIRNKAGSEAYARYQELETEKESLTKQLVEIEEAITAANRVRATADVAYRNLESAEDWATYDVWTRGGIISHMAKYEHVDNAEESFNRLSYQLKDLQRELEDVDMMDAPGVTVIDSTTRTIDFWFDNIFTDLGVRDKIRSDMHQVDKLDVQISRIVESLDGKKTEIMRKLAELDKQKKDLIISEG